MSDIKLPPLPPEKLECGLARLNGRPEFTAAETQAYARQAVLVERERCAQICDAEVVRLSDLGERREAVVAGICAAAIRASEERPQTSDKALRELDRLSKEMGEEK